MNNRPIHFEIFSANPSKTAEFYTGLFGWDIQKWDNPEMEEAGMEYWMIMTAPEGSGEPGINGGISQRKSDMAKAGEPYNAFVCSVQVDSVDEYIKKVEEMGGKVTQPKMPIVGMGWMAYCMDLEGNTFGLYQDDKNAK